MSAARSLFLSNILCGFLGSLCGACGNHGSLCADAMECEGGNDADTDACVIQLDAGEELASIENCTEEWDAYLTCFEEEASCDDDNFTTRTRCEDEEDDLGDCMG